MRAIILGASVLIAGPLAMAVPGVAGDRAQTACARGEYVRTVSVVSEPREGYVCEVHYEKTSEGGGNEVLWNARNDAAFCRAQADKLTARLIQAGWSCAPSAQSAEAPAATTLAEPLSVAVAPGAESGGEGITAATRKGAVPADTEIKRAAPAGPSAQGERVQRGTIDPNDPALDGRAPVDPASMLRPAQN